LRQRAATLSVGAWLPRTLIARQFPSASSLTTYVTAMARVHTTPIWTATSLVPACGGHVINASATPSMAGLKISSSNGS